jgi:hypothetical protein
MTGSAKKPPLNILIGNIGRTGLHGKADIDMTQSAGKPGPMQPVLENYRRFIGLAGIIVNHHSPKRMGFGPVLLDPEFLGQGQTANQAHRYGQPDNKLFSHLNLHQFSVKKPLSPCRAIYL